MLLRSHVRLSTYISHFSTLFQNFISCSQKIWFCVFLELGKPYLRQDIPTNCQLNAKSSSVLPHWRCNLFVLHYWFWCHSKWYFFKYPVAFQIISLPFSFVYLTAVTRYKELLFFVCKFFTSSSTPVEAREAVNLWFPAVLSSLFVLCYFHDCTTQVILECFILKLCL